MQQTPPKINFSFLHHMLSILTSLNNEKPEATVNIGTLVSYVGLIQVLGSLNQ